MSDVVSLAERRWETNDDPKAHKPHDMLRLLADRLEHGDLKDAEPVIVLVGAEPPDGGLGKRLRYMQAGSYDHFGQLGLITSCAHMLDT